MSYKFYFMINKNDYKNLTKSDFCQITNSKMKSLVFKTYVVFTIFIGSSLASFLGVSLPATSFLVLCIIELYHCCYYFIFFQQESIS